MRTFRELGVSLFDIGDALSYREAVLLAQSASLDTTTHLGAALSGWGFPASIPEVVQLQQAGAKKLLPWEFGLRPAVTTAEVEQAWSELEAEVLFS